METAREYAQELYSKEKAEFRDLDIDEKTHLAGLLILEAGNAEVGEVLANIDNGDAITLLLAKYMTTADPDKRIELIAKFTVETAYFFKNRINTLLEQVAQEHQDGELQRLPEYKRPFPHCGAYSD